MQFLINTIGVTAALMLFSILAILILMPAPGRSRFQRIVDLLWPNLSPPTIITHVAAFAILLASCIDILPAGAQVQSTVFTYPGWRNTFSAAATGIAPAASATDFFTITGSASKTIRISRIICNGTANAASGIPVYLEKRSTANAGGTATSPAAVAHDSSNAAASAVVRAYTGNAATPGTLVGLLRAAPLILATNTTPAIKSGLEWDFGNNSDQMGTLHGANDVLAMNANGVSFPAGASVNCSVEWTEQ